MVAKAGKAMRKFYIDFNRLIEIGRENDTEQEYIYIYLYIAQLLLLLTHTHATLLLIAWFMGYYNNRTVGSSAARRCFII